MPLEGMVAQWCARATTTNGRDAHFTLDFRRDRQPFDRFEMDSRLLSEFRVPSKVEGDACPTTTNRDRRPFDKLRVPSKVEGDACPTNTLDHGRALTCSHLATSQSHSLTRLSRTTTTANLDLTLTCRSSVTSSAWQSEMASAGPVAGAGVPVGGAELSLVGRGVPAVRDLGFGGLGTARPTGGIRGAELSWVGTAVPTVRDLGFGGLGTARPTGGIQDAELSWVGRGVPTAPLAVDKTHSGLRTLRRRSERTARPTTAVFRTLPVGWRQPEVWIV